MIEKVQYTLLNCSEEIYSSVKDCVKCYGFLDYLNYSYVNNENIVIRPIYVFDVIYHNVMFFIDGSYTYKMDENGKKKYNNDYIDKFRKILLLTFPLEEYVQEFYENGIFSYEVVDIKSEKGEFNEITIRGTQQEWEKLKGMIEKCGEIEFENEYVNSCWKRYLDRCYMKLIDILFYRFTNPTPEFFKRGYCGMKGWLTEFYLEDIFTGIKYIKFVEKDTEKMFVKTLGFCKIVSDNEFLNLEIGEEKYEIYNKTKFYNIG